MNFQCQSIGYGHTGAIWRVRVDSLNGRYALSCGQDATLRLWSIQSKTTLIDPKTKSPTVSKLQPLKIFEKGHSNSIFDCVISSNNTFFASVGEDKNCCIWDVGSGKLVNRFRAHDHRINCTALNWNNNVLFTGSYDKTVKLWDLRMNSRYPALQFLSDCQDSVSCFSVPQKDSNSAHIHYFVVGSYDGFVRSYDLRKGNFREDFIGDPILSVDLSHDNTRNMLLVSSFGGKSGIIRLLDFQSGKFLSQSSGHLATSYSIESKFLQPSDKLLFSGSEDGRIWFWDVFGAPKCILKGHQDTVTSVSYYPGISDIVHSGSVESDLKLLKPKRSNVKLVSASFDSTVRIWIPSSSPPLLPLTIDSLEYAGEGYRNSTILIGPSSSSSSSSSHVPVKAQLPSDSKDQESADPKPKPIIVSKKFSGQVQTAKRKIPSKFKLSLFDFD